MLVPIATIVAIFLATSSADERLPIDKRIENAAKLSREAGLNPVPDDSVLVELDILYKKETWADILQRKSADEGARSKRKATRYEYYRWTDATIPYEFQPDTFSEADMRNIHEAFDDWNKYTCLNMRPATSSDQNYIYIESLGGCSAYVGMIGGGQMVNLGEGCRSVATVLHELGHAIGLQHEQCRPDRDDWVDVHLENVYDGLEFNFDRFSDEEVNNYGIFYDYRSIMHYSQLAFSANSEVTIESKDPYFQRLIGLAEGLSFRDIRIVNDMYHCNEHCAPQDCDGEGFVGKDCQCWCPGDPIQPCGDVNPEVPEDECMDYYEDCPYYADRGDCETDREWMYYYCHVSCELCNPDSNCYDYEGNCDYYSHIGWCDEHQDYMSYYCSKSCRFCDPKKKKVPTATLR